MVNHTGDNFTAFKCEKCEKSFTLASNLKTHIVIRTGEGPFQCHICEKSFTQAINLKAHGDT